MADQRALDALRRIDDALVRIEAVAARPNPAAAGELDELRRAHERLRERVTGAVSQLDRLITAGESD